MTMKNIIQVVLFTTVFAVTAGAQTIYEIPIRKLDGDTIRLREWQGKKILFILAPLTNEDSVYSQLLAFSNLHRDSLQVVGIPSIEDGYQTTGAPVLRQMYEGSGIVLTEAMYTRKTSGGQSVLLRWLTDKNYNQRYDRDVAGTGHKFFISATGRLYAVMSPTTSLQSAIVNRIVQSGTH